MQTRKKITSVYIIAIVALAALFAICTFFDFEISKAITIIGEGKYYPESLAGRFFETFGVIPVYALPAFALSIIFHYFMREKAGDKAVKAICGVIIGILCAVLGYMMFKKVFKYVSIHFGFDDLLGGVTDEIAYALMGVLSAGALLYFMKDVSDEFLNKTFAWAVMVAITAAGSQLVVQGVKLFAGRARYATINVTGDSGLYTPWYIFNGSRVPSNEMLTLGAGSDAFRSFPSGHTAAAAVSLCLAVLPVFFGLKKNNVSFWLLIVLPSIFTLGTLVSRVVEGAHYCTDVIFSLACVITAIYFGLKVSFALQKKIKPLGSDLPKRVTEEKLSD